MSDAGRGGWRIFFANVVSLERSRQAVVDLLCDRDEEILPRLCAIAFTDSFHNMTGVRGKQFANVRAALDQRAINWAKSSLPLDTVLPRKDGVQRRSAGHATHEWTSSAAIESVLTFLDTQFARRLTPVRVRKSTK